MLLSHITGTRLGFIPHPVLPPPAGHQSEQHDEAPFCFQHVTESSLLWERLFKDNKFLLTHEVIYSYIQLYTAIYRMFIMILYCVPLAVNVQCLKADKCINNV